MKTGIYKIENLINHKVYIGQAQDIAKRWVNHRSAMNNPNDHCYNYHLYRSMRKYGIENFDFAILEECNIAELNEREKYWIQYYDSFFNGYNATLGGDSSRNIPKENILGIIHDLETTEMKHREIAEKWSVSTETVQGINTGRYWKQDRDYPIQQRTKILTKQRENAVQQKCCDCGKGISKGAIRCRDCDTKYRQLINPSKMTASREELKGLIRTKSFCEIGRLFSMSDNSIRKWCVKYNLPSTKGKINSYSDEEWANL